MEKQFEGYLNKAEIKVAFEGNAIFFPVSVEYVNLNKFNGDARSFGYHFDDGYCTVVEYEKAVGALADDTVALIRLQKNKPRSPSVGIGAIDTFEHSADVANSWKVGLSTDWAESRYQQWLKEGLVDDGETKEEWIASELNSYHSWPMEWIQKYNEHREQLNSPIGELSVVLKHEELTLFKDESEQFFFETKYYDHGKRQKADPQSAKAYIDLYKIWQEQVRAYSALSVQVDENLKQLQTVFGAEI